MDTRQRNYEDLIVDIHDAFNDDKTVFNGEKNMHRTKFSNKLAVSFLLLFIVQTELRAFKRSFVSILAFYHFFRICLLFSSSFCAALLGVIRNILSRIILKSSFLYRDKAVYKVSIKDNRAKGFQAQFDVIKGIHDCSKKNGYCCQSCNNKVHHSVGGMRFLILYFISFLYP